MYTKRALIAVPFLFGSRFLHMARLPTTMLLALWSLAAAALECPTDRTDATVSVSYVYDGDTVKLTDGRKLRFIGINTPEMGRQQQPAEPFAAKARQRVQQLLEPTQRLVLRYDTQRHDRYGRQLAHVYLADGRNLTRILLQEGLATALVVPPNLWQFNCYARAEQTAYAQQQGLWSHPHYQPLDVKELNRHTRGYRIISGKVTRVGKSKSSVWLNLDKQFALRIKREDLPYFGEINLDMLHNRRVIARGWIYSRNKQLRMRIRHPAALVIQ